MKKDLSSLIKQAQVKKIEPKKQEVKPVKESVMKNEKAFSLYIDIDILKKLKLLSIEKEKSMKDLINEAIIECYFKP
ncbi:Uncharacterised protein [Candidatus Ornithobacterium hominis]|uniref:Ribbon-helix-helix protein CopG domain-containing protein n=1 Tax=Candidatus Ornithobacterium hominis TaxID=2497989 RepID=A0A383U507_9FLAO|nr:hypothetical protein [Candidatus Ornithobacterium hominis]MCT7905115.1 hypothetical protein [Candidatus Ornithobacterium hominis]CAI9429397.1 RHH-1 domain-containing protein [Candidatus Ornithobacterium hominis]SZD74221.1 Uncharacterised protein [Candidatus Ornithobacterium hominis]